MDAFQCESKRSGWQGLTASRGAAFGAAASPVITASVVVAATAAMMAILASKAARFAGRWSAGLAVARVALVVMEMAAAPAAAAAPPMFTSAAEFPLGRGVTFGRRLFRA